MYIVCPLVERDDQCHPFNGRCQKIASLAASKASLAFNRYLGAWFLIACKWMISFLASVIETNDPLHGQKVWQACFDARCFALPTSEEVLNCIVWRIQDVKRNSRTNFARQFMSQKRLNRVTAAEAQEMFV